MHDIGVSAPEPVIALPAARDSWQAIVAHQALPPAPVRGDGLQLASSLPLGPFGATIDELKRRAEAGDPRAAKALAEGYRRCEFFTPPAGQQDLEKRAEDKTVNSLNFVDQIVDQVKESATRKGIKLPAMPKIDSLSVYQQQLKTEVDLAEACRGVERADASTWRTWYARAAELGEPDAELDYWQVALANASMASLDEIPRQKDIAASALQRSLSHGDPRALAAIGAVLEYGYFADPDPFLAHAYYFAASQAPNNDIASFPWASGGVFMRLATGSDTHTYLARRLRATALPLKPAQVLESEHIGAQLFASCCTGGHP
ncbi:MAG: hypothetical protein ABI748_04965 [Dokdonella sp.]